VFSRDYQAVMRTVEELQFGEIYVNRTLGESIHAHHAGYRESGIGGEDGKWGLLRYTQVKTAYHHYGLYDRAGPAVEVDSHPRHVRGAI
jgi:lactaldehyde dehydrogenase/glycolaldehyde dehydrogenase